MFYHGSGNPSNWNPVQRPGDNKWTSSLFARELNTGKASWVYQMTPHDEWGYDGVNEIILVDQKINDKMQKTAVHFDANGFAYTMDRINGGLLVANSFDPSVNWSKGINLATGLHERVVQYSTDKNGPDVTTTDLCPYPLGSKNQQPASYSPKTGLFYVPTNHLCVDYEPYKVDYISGEPYGGATFQFYPALDGKHEGDFIAWDARTGQKVWSNPERFSVWSGTVVTETNLVFYGTTEGYIKGLDARTGRELWRFKTATGIVGNVNSYQYKDKQYISVLSGRGRLAGFSAQRPKFKYDYSYKGGYSHNSRYDLQREWRNLGGVLSVFTLPNKPLK